MKNAKALPISIASIILVVFLSLSFILYDASESIAVKGVAGSYAQTYAKDNDLEFIEIHDSENDKVEIPIINEEEYAANEDKAENNKEKLATPEKVTAKTKSVTSIALTWNPVKKADSYDIYQADIDGSFEKIATVSADSPTNYLVEELASNTVYFFAVKAISDSDRIDNSDFSEVVYEITAKDNAEFSYDYENESINITEYKGSAEEVVVPETLDELPVNSISMNVLNKGIKVVQIPESVTRIDSEFKSSRYNAIFYMALAIMLLGYIFAIIATLVGFKKNDTSKGTFYGIPFVYSGMVTYIAMTIWCAVALKVGISPLIQCVVAIVLLGLAVIRLVSAGVAREIIVDKDEQVQQKTHFVKMLGADAQALVTRAKSDEAKALANNVYEAVRYSDPMSVPELGQIEMQIQDEFFVFSGAIDDDNISLAKTSSDKIINLIELRNNRCKALK